MSDGAEITVSLGRISGREVIADVRSSGGGGGSSADPNACVYRVVPVPLGPDLPSLSLPPPPSDEALPYWLFCGDALVRGFWVLPGDIVDIDGIAASAAERHVETILAPGLGLDANPPGGALTGLATYLWVDGWDGAPIDVEPVEALGQRVDVRLWLERVDWDLGDGTALTADLGRAWPDESTVAHTYLDRAPGDATTVSARIVIGAEYRYGGGAPVPLAPLTVDQSLELGLREIQAVIG
ncbi:MAG TPA: hypothetical protein VK866_15930 [Acidimicrobiales bacterium]|nr:hypothetical protein [Acidimicrobiales bacterium]